MTDPDTTASIPGMLSTSTGSESLGEGVGRVPATLRRVEDFPSACLTAHRLGLLSTDGVPTSRAWADLKSALSPSAFQSDVHAVVENGLRDSAGATPLERLRRLSEYIASDGHYDFAIIEQADQVADIRRSWGGGPGMFEVVLAAALLSRHG